MNTPNRKNRRLLAVLPAGACAAAMLLAGLGSTAAFAANAGTITLTAPAGETLANHSFSAYKIGDYSGYADANANGKIDGTNVTNAAGAQAWLKAALTKAGLGVDSAKGLDEAGTLAATTQAAKLSTVANALADAANKPGAVVADKTSNTGSLTLNVPGEGLYLVVDSDGLPIIVGTKINGKDLEKQALGTAVIKSTSISVDKEGSGDTTIGKTVSYTATFKIPQKNANPTKLSYTDQPTNLAIVRNSLKIKVDNQAAVAVPSEAITWNRDGGFTPVFPDPVPGSFFLFRFLTITGFPGPGTFLFMPESSWLPPWPPAVIGGPAGGVRGGVAACPSVASSVFRFRCRRADWESVSCCRFWCCCWWWPRRRSRIARSGCCGPVRRPGMWGAVSVTRWWR